MIQNNQLKIGIMGLAAKPIPTVEGNICAPHAVIENLTSQLHMLGHEVIIFSGQDSQIQSDGLISEQLNSAWEDYGPEDENPINFTERKIEYEMILSLKAIEFFKSKQVDIINSHDIRFNPYLFKLANVPVLYTPHFNLSTRNDSYDKYRYKLMQDRLFGVTNISQANDEFCKSNGLATFGIVPNGIDVEKYQFNQEGRHGFLLVGRMVPGKMIKEAIEITGRLNEKITLIGPKGSKVEDIKYYEELEKDYLNRPYVTYLGYKKPKEIISYYQHASVLLFPSKSEGLPLGILEAMATGLPVVASHIGGIPDIIEDGTTGCLVNSLDKEEWEQKIKIALKLDAKTIRNSIVSKFSLQKMSESYLKAYNNFIRR